MTIDEVRAMCLWLSKLIPHQQFDEDTPEAWCPLLANVAVADARTVVLGILKREPYVNPNAIASEVKKLRRDRLAASGFETICPNVDPDDTARYAAERRALRDTIASGAMTRDQLAAYEAGETAPLTGGAPYARASLESARPGGVLAAIATRTVVSS